ncbi:MAG: hypothetical protein HOB79_17480 [Rhodospirillaceae bacterium]|jgi:hypothetical protein|nr:hypothetical protein [Rhodospirillales bacterium]MBT3905087.1 hypothetical protein [Rhodospirillaceae bacterium]MBT4702865.1 hypothetical protein [Rhodospirillaceae bacterium]MBT5034250.1 hypothetical protein [Rhodospirillaceae bacterium]MBT6218177.1 hypothetical protein [Rhodospirillaceae bacterium]
MALIARVQQPVATAPTAPTAGRTVASVRGNASDRGQVEEINTSGSISFDNTALIFQEQERALADNTNQDRRNNRPRAENPGSFNAPTDLFVSLLEINERGEKSDTGNGFKGGPGDFKKAIAVYEDTVRVITGSFEKLGSSLSLIL